ncbi:DDE-type integrase/transposase/recombinase [Micromonospora arida]|uniref:DDE-type integrase/transposase/recombinase n=1 Tax=Micromonospora arida TaxID=2203715 RepID=UPI0033C4F304
MCTGGSATARTEALKSRRISTTVNVTIFRVGVRSLCYAYPAIDQHRQVIDVPVSARRDTAAARRFFQRALRILMVTPSEMVTDAAPVYPAVLDDLIASAWHHLRAARTQSDRQSRMGRVDAGVEYRRPVGLTPAEASPNALRPRLDRAQHPGLHRPAPSPRVCRFPSGGLQADCKAPAFTVADHYAYSGRRSHSRPA